MRVLQQCLDTYFQPSISKIVLNGASFPISYKSQVNPITNATMGYHYSLSPM